MTSLRAQGATEYLVVAAVVLVIGLIAITLLGFFPSIASDTKAKQSQAYWMSARPTGLYDAKATETVCNGSNRGYTLTLENHESTPIRLTGISIAGQNSGFCRQGQALTSEIMLDTGQKVVIETPANISSSAGTSISANISISYTSTYGITRVQYGTTPLVITNSLPPALPTAGLGESCATLSCGSGLVCIEGTCENCRNAGADCNIGAGGPLNAYCCSSSPYCSYDGGYFVCSTSCVGTPCSDNSDCCADTPYCDGQNLCQTSCSGFCIDSGDCCAGMFCMELECRNCPNTGASCWSSSDCCAGLVCLGSMMMTCQSCPNTGARCWSSSDCCAGMVCDMMDGRCRICPHEGTYCSDSSYCCSGMICNQMTQSCQ